MWLQLSLSQQVAACDEGAIAQGVRQCGKIALWKTGGCRKLSHRLLSSTFLWYILESCQVIPKRNY